MKRWLSRTIGQLRCRPRWRYVRTVVLMCALSQGACIRDIIYHPSEMTPQQVAQIASRTGWEQVTVKGEVDLVGIVRRPAPGQLVLLFFGGNDMSLDDSQGFLLNLTKNVPCGLAVFAYRGYDGSGGSPTEQGLVQDAERIARYLMDTLQIPANRLVPFGYSLGSGVATQLAAALSRAHEAPAGLVLGAPYASMAGVFDDHTSPVPSGWMVPDRFESVKFAPDVTCPVLLAHGEADAVIPVHNAVDLAGVFGTRATLVRVPEGRHNNVFASPLAMEALTKFMARAGSR
jgi:fermentation-respiration switch protein FrsA (DUF1100 family)